MEAAEVFSHRQSQDRHETSSLVCDTSIVHQNAARRSLVDPEHAEALMALALNATGLVVLGARADSQFSSVTTLGPGSRHGGGVFIMDVVRVVLAGVPGAVPAECADAVRRRSDAVRRRRAWVKRLFVDSSVASRVSAVLE